jgi:hypothetical protein
METTMEHRIQMILMSLASTLSKKSTLIKRPQGTIQITTCRLIRSDSKMSEEWTLTQTAKISKITLSTIAVLNQYFKTQMLN